MRLSSVLWVLIIVALGVCGCWQAEDPGQQRYDSGAEPSVDTTPDGAAGCPEKGSISVTLEDPPVSTCQTRQPFRGRAVGADRVVVQGPVGTSAPATVSADGRFCVEVQLTPDASNEITFLPVDLGGCPGHGRVHAIQHGTDCAASTAAAAVNLARGGTVLGSGTHKGDKASLVDGKLDTVVEYQGGGWGFDDADIKIQIALGKPVQVEKIVVRWRDAQGKGCDYATDYSVATSAQADASLGDSAFSKVASVKDGDGGEDSFSLPAKTPVRHVGLRLQNNGCSTWSETFALREVEVWGRDPAAAAPPPDRCL